jgi:hypothetical protein
MACRRLEVDKTQSLGKKLNPANLMQLEQLWFTEFTNSHVGNLPLM